jgi:hypothetical protein
MIVAAEIIAHLSVDAARPPPLVLARNLRLETARDAEVHVVSGRVDE